MLLDPEKLIKDEELNFLEEVANETLGDTENGTEANTQESEE